MSYNRDAINRAGPAPGVTPNRINQSFLFAAYSGRQSLDIRGARKVRSNPLVPRPILSAYPLAG